MSMNRVHSLDYLRIVLAVGVVFVHAGLMSGYRAPLALMIGNGMLNLIIPLFSVLSGFCLYLTHEHGKARKWLGALIVVYLLWSAFYAPVWIRQGDVSIRMIMGYAHLWYVAWLIIDGALMFLLIGLGRRTGTGLMPLIALAVVLALLGTVNGYMHYWLNIGVEPEYLHRGVVVMFPYMVLGYVIGRRTWRRGRACWPEARLLWPVAVVLLALKMGEAYLRQDPGFSLLSTEMPNLPLLEGGVTLAIFLALLRTDLPQPSVDLSYLSVMIYFLHMFVLLVMLYLGVRNVWIGTVAGIAVPVFVAVALRQMWGRFARTSSG